MSSYLNTLISFLESSQGELNALAVLIRLTAALVLGFIIGWERANKRHSAGLRTFILVTLSGTCVMMLDSFIVSQAAGGIFILSAAFLLALSNISIHSVFYSSKNEIRGLTTAVALWMMGLIGMLIGRDLFEAALIAFLILMCTLSWFPAIERFFKNRSNHFEIHLELKDSVYLQDFVTTIRRLGLTIDDIEMNRAYIGSGLSVYSIAISISSKELKKYKTHEEIIVALRTLDYIYHIEEMV